MSHTEELKDAVTRLDSSQANETLAAPLERQRAWDKYLHEVANTDAATEEVIASAIDEMLDHIHSNRTLTQAHGIHHEDADAA
jgi:hypothetical protein